MVIFSPLATPTPAQEAELTPASTPVVYPEELHAGADQEAAPDLKGRPPPVVIPPPAAPPAAALELALACAASPDLTGVLPPLPEEPSLELSLAPATEEEPPLEDASGPALELIIIQLVLPLPPEVVLPFFLTFFL